jgi:hypothetical protein
MLNLICKTIGLFMVIGIIVLLFVHPVAAIIIILIIAHYAE